MKRFEFKVPKDVEDDAVSPQAVAQAASEAWDLLGEEGREGLSYEAYTTLKAFKGIHGRLNAT